LLDAAHDLTLEGAIALAFNSQVYHAALWQERLQAAWTKAPDADRQSDAAEVCGLIQQWDHRSDADSAGALAYYAFKKGLAERSARAVDPPSSLTDEEMFAALAKAAAWLKTNFGSLQVPYGRFFRVGREGGQRTYPVSGGSVSDAGMATVRAIGFSKAGREMVGRSGQTSTQIVIMTDPPESYTLVPLGVSDHKESGHWDDQAEKLLSKGKATPTYFLNRAELLKHVTATMVLIPSKE
jgi:acyl-homoserine lactone acylase PvdQ